jgi:hypothetical protein
MSIPCPLHSGSANTCVVYSFLALALRRCQFGVGICIYGWFSCLFCFVALVLCLLFLWIPGAQLADPAISLFVYVYVCVYVALETVIYISYIYIIKMSATGC